MERLRERIGIARRALGTLKDALANDPTSTLVRDAAIQCFEYTFEAVWKAAQRFLLIMESIEVGSPKGVIRSSFQVKLLDEAQTRLALQMADDRNLTTLTYNESLAVAIFSHLQPYSSLMDEWLGAMEARLATL